MPQFGRRAAGARGARLDQPDHRPHHRRRRADPGPQPLRPGRAGLARGAALPDARAGGDVGLRSPPLHGRLFHPRAGRASCSRCAACVLAAARCRCSRSGSRNVDLEDPDLARRDLPVALGDRDPRLSDRDDARPPRAMEIVGGDWARVGQVGIVFVMTARRAGRCCPRPSCAPGCGSSLAKHLFEHRYDYREEWLRFTDTVGRAGGDERLARGARGQGARRHRRRAGRPAAARRRASTGFVAAGALELGPAELPPTGDGAEALLALSSSRAASSSTSTRSATAGWSRGETRVPVPAWLAGIDRAWAGIPLIHDGRLAGLVVLEHPADPPPRSTGRISTCSAPPASRPPPISPRRAASRRSPTPSASTSSTAASPSSCTTSRIWSASSAWSPATPSATPTIPNSAPT